VTGGQTVEQSALRDHSARLRADLILTETFALLVGLTVCAVLLGGYHAGFTPRQRLERQVRTGLRHNEFYVEYQAIVDLDTGDWIGAEALLRWRHPRLGLIMPGKFIGEIESTPVRTWQHTKSLRREGLPCDLGGGWIFRIRGHPATISGCP
jgi:sensor c-di-GMP phosphodiesterase-like protein